VHSAFIRFPGLLIELGLSSQRNEVLAVKKNEVPIHLKALGVPSLLGAAMLYFNFIIMTELPFYQGNCMPFPSTIYKRTRYLWLTLVF